MPFLRDGLMRHHVFAAYLPCAASDAALIALGATGFGTYVSIPPALLRIVSWGGNIFLAVYGASAFRRALNPSQRTGSAVEMKPLGETLAACAAFTFLTPHAHLDSAVLVGGLSVTYSSSLSFSFDAVAMLAWFTWFFGLAMAQECWMKFPQNQKRGAFLMH